MFELACINRVVTCALSANVCHREEMRFPREYFQDYCIDCYEVTYFVGFNLGYFFNRSEVGDLDEDLSRLRVLWLLEVIHRQT